MALRNCRNHDRIVEPIATDGALIASGELVGTVGFLRSAAVLARGRYEPARIRHYVPCSR
jgi:hypothetical protein